MNRVVEDRICHDHYTYKTADRRQSKTFYKRYFCDDEQCYANEKISRV